jgi:hypothetical protein
MLSHKPEENTWLFENGSMLNLSALSLSVTFTLQTLCYVHFIIIFIFHIHTKFKILSSSSLLVSTVQLKTTRRLSHCSHKIWDGLLWHNVHTKFCENRLNVNREKKKNTHTHTKHGNFINTYIW